MSKDRVRREGRERGERVRCGGEKERVRCGGEKERVVEAWKRQRGLERELCVEKTFGEKCVCLCIFVHIVKKSYNER